MSVSDRDSISIAATLSTTNQTYGTHYVPVVYTVDGDGNYVLKSLYSGAETLNGKVYTATELTDDTITPKVAAFSGDFTGVGNVNTAFTVANYDSTTHKLSTVNAYTGIANAPKYTRTADGVVIDVDGVAAMVFVVNGTQQDTSATSDYAYIPSSVTYSYDSATKLYTYAGAYVNGEETDLLSKVILTADTLLKVSMNDDNQVVSFVNVNTLGNAYASETGISYADGVVTIGTRTSGTKAYYTLAEDAKVFEIEDGVVTEIAASAISSDKTDTVVVLGASDMNTTLVAKYIYITKNNSSTATATTKTVAGTPVTSTDVGAATSFTATKNTSVAIVVTGVADGATVSVAVDKNYSTSFSADEVLTSDGAGNYTFTASNPSAGSVVDMVRITITAENGTSVSYYASATVNT